MDAAGKEEILIETVGSGRRRSTSSITRTRSCSS